MKKIVVIVLLFPMLGSNCSKEEFPLDASGLTYRGQFVYADQFRIDGAYYLAGRNEGVSVRYFYKDGSCYSSGDADFSIESIQCLQISSRGRELPYLWGFFIVDGDIIKIQTFDPGSLHRYRRFRVEEWWAKIENDTTIRVFKRIFPNGDIMSHDLLFLFKHCENKPDSTNILQR